MSIAKKWEKMETWACNKCDTLSVFDTNSCAKEMGCLHCGNKKIELKTITLDF